MIRTTLVLLLLATTAFAQMGTSAGHDLDDLWSRAQAGYDLAELDAVILLETHDVTVTAGFDLVTRVHRVVWVGTRAGQNAHADLRIPWNSATSSFRVEILRTWRDGSWWPDATKLSDTAVVETLPHAVRTAWDYQDLRETMLLHDGVEAPCIMETAYTVVERGGAAPGADGQFIFTRREPAVQVEFGIDVPVGTELDLEVRNFRPDFDPGIGEGETRHRIYVSDRPARRLPDVDATAHEPCVQWSTWGGDPAPLAAHLETIFSATALTSPAMTDSVAKRLAAAATPVARVRAVAGLVDEMTRHVHLRRADVKLELRDAARVWDTGYASDADRASLAFALFREAGLEPVATFVEEGAGAAPLVGRFDAALMLQVGHPAVLYDPANGELRAPVVRSGAPGHGHRATLDLTLAPGEEGWTGHGSLQTSGLLNPWPEMAADHGDGLDRVAAGALAGADAGNVSPEWFDAQAMAVGFDLDLEAPEADVQGRTPFLLGGLAGGVIDHLPHGVETWRETRTSPVVLRAPMAQSLTLRLSLGAAALVRAPAPRELVNAVGRFALAVDESDGVLTVTRELELTSPTVSAEQWPLLRALLLEESDPANGAILLRED